MGVTCVPEKWYLGGYMVTAVIFKGMGEDCSTSDLLHCRDIYSSFSACAPQDFSRPHLKVLVQVSGVSTCFWIPLAALSLS